MKIFTQTKENVKYELYVFSYHSCSLPFITLLWSDEGKSIKYRFGFMLKLLTFYTLTV
jgi:hypothetical protein